jgi:hypothetical protein
MTDSHPPQLRIGGPAKAAGEVNVLALVKGEERYVFLYGDDERPVYSGGSWSSGMPPADVRAAGKEAHKIQALEIGALGDLSFRATVDERTGHRAVKIYAIDTTDDEVVASLEFDLEQRGVSLFGLAGVDIQGRGFVNIDAPQVQINDRLVATKAGPI